MGFTELNIISDNIMNGQNKFGCSFMVGLRHSNLRQGLKGLPGINTLAYFAYFTKNIFYNSGPSLTNIVATMKSEIQSLGSSGTLNQVTS